ncbi:MAG: heparinase II/III family protein, partial [Candidatus Hydrogenedentes bacterium]|nr:heparinase II/III family protein [Candidatus Hydrogenedentota bacterium]
VPIAYGHPLYTRWYATTLAHNTVVVNQQSQRTTSGELIHFSTDAWGGQSAGRCDTAYRGVVLERWVILHENVLADVFRCHAANASTFDYPLHFVGGFTNLPAAERSGPLGVEDGYDQLNDVLRFTEPPSQFTVRTGPLSHLDVRVLTPGHDTYIAQGFGATPRDMTPMLILRSRGTDAVFATATQFLEDKQDPVEVAWDPAGAFIIGERRIPLEQWVAPAETAVQ